MRVHRLLLAGALVAMPAAVQGGAHVSAEQDQRWQPFLGCWTPLAAEAETAVTDVVCFQLEADGSVVNTTFADGVLQTTETIIADGRSRPVTDGACSGTETARFSADGARVYLRSALSCGADVLGRDAAGVLALATAGTLIEVQSVGVDDEFGVRVLRYRALAPTEYPDAARSLASRVDETARVYAAAPLTIGDVKDAAAALPTAAVTALLVNVPATSIKLDADALLALDEAGLDPEIIDLVVALAHPERFAIAADPGSIEEEDGRRTRAVWLDDPFEDRWRYGRYGRYGRYARYGYDPYYYSPFGYGSHGWGYGGGYGGGVIIIDRDDLDDGGSGSVVKGEGYSRGSRSSTGAARTRDDGSSNMRPRSPTPATGARATGSSSGSGSSSKAKPTRTAKPRGGNRGN